MSILKPCPIHPEKGIIDLAEGCPECIHGRIAGEAQAEAKEQGINPDEEAANATAGYLVKARFHSSDYDGTGREYTYYSEDRLDVEDIVKAPGSNGGTRLIITGVDVDPAEIEAFKDKVKVIPAGSVLQLEIDEDALPPGGLAEAAQAAGAEVNVVEMVEQEQLTDEEEARIMAEGDIPISEDIIVEVATVAVALELDSAVKSLVEQANKFLEYADGRVVNSPTSEKFASDDLVLIRTTKKQIEKKRKEYLDPVNAKAAEIRDYFKQLQDPIEQADKLTADKILDYGREVTRQREEAERIEAEALQLAKDQEKLTGEHTVSLEEISKPAPEKQRIRSDVGLTSKVKHWKWKVVDADAIPREYLIPDEAMLNSIAKKHHDGKVIPGLMFYNDPHLSTRSG